MPRSPENRKNQVRDVRGRFKPGVSGNPGGRPRDARNREALALFGERAVEIAERCIEMALAGDTAALKLALARACPALKDLPVDLPLSIEERPTFESVIRAQSIIIQELAAGRISPGAAHDLMRPLRQLQQSVSEAAEGSSGLEDFQPIDLTFDTPCPHCGHQGGQESTGEGNDDE